MLSQQFFCKDKLIEYDENLDTTSCRPFVLESLKQKQNYFDGNDNNQT